MHMRGCGTVFSPARGAVQAVSLHKLVEYMQDSGDVTEENIQKWHDLIRTSGSPLALAPTRLALSPPPHALLRCGSEQHGRGQFGRRD